jgi:hypothetical protein
MPTAKERRAARVLSFTAPPAAPTTREGVERAYAVHDLLARLHKGEEPEDQIMQEAASAGLLDALLAAKAQAEATSRHGRHKGQLTDVAFNAAVAAPVV